MQEAEVLAHTLFKALTVGFQPRAPEVLWESRHFGLSDFFSKAIQLTAKSWGPEKLEAENFVVFLVLLSEHVKIFFRVTDQTEGTHGTHALKPHHDKGFV